MKDFLSFSNPLIFYDKIEQNLNWQEEFGRKAPLNVEIGFGMGEFLVRTALKNPSNDFVGIETDWERIHKTLKRIKRESTEQKKELKNVRILKIDARIAFLFLFSSQAIDNIFCLFPCPWPKKEHIKYRLFTNDFLSLMNNRLVSKGQIQIVTDSFPFYEWILGEVKNSGFSVKTEKISPKFDTKYERKWQAGGQNEFYEIVLIKEKHIKVEEQKRVNLKAYKINNFNPDNFQFEDKTDAVSVILKDFVFDYKKERGTFLFVVAEDKLTQYFRVLIDKRKDGWQICRADGQNLFPTPGIEMALQLTFEAVEKTAAQK